MTDDSKHLAVLTNYLDNIGGAEQVGLITARELGADIHTTCISREKLGKMGFRNLRIKSIGGVPVHAPFRQQLTQYRFRRLDLKGRHDNVFINGEWAMSAAVKNKPNIWYVHSPIREIWDLYTFVRENNVPWHLRPIFDQWVRINRRINLKHVKHVDTILANSENTMARIKKYLGRESEVLHPPVETDELEFRESGDYWLSVNRLIAHKRVWMQIDAFRNMPSEKLVIVGSYEKSHYFQKHAKKIRSMIPENVTLLHWISREKLRELYAGCRGFITSSLDEDFGITPVEAMAAGKPVIAPNEGGYRETVIDGETGTLIDDIRPEKIIRAVKEIGENPESYRKACEKQAQKFSTQTYLKKLREKTGI